MGLGGNSWWIGSESCLSSFSLSISESFDGTQAPSSVLEWLSRQRAGDRVIVTIVIYWDCLVTSIVLILLHMLFHLILVMTP